MRELVIAPHPDDEVLGCGGVIAKHAAEGSEVHVLIVTRGIPELWSDADVLGIRKEMGEAHRILGVAAASFLDFPAPCLDSVPGYRLANAIKAAVRELSPERVYVPHRGDLHADHQAVFRAVLVATRPTKGCAVREVLSYETLSETDWGAPFPGEAFVPNVFVDISLYLQCKLQALKCFKGQLRTWPHPRSACAVEALARLRGAAVGVDAAESFMLVRSVLR